MYSFIGVLSLKTLKKDPKRNSCGEQTAILEHGQNNRRVLP